MITIENHNEEILNINYGDSCQDLSVSLENMRNLEGPICSETVGRRRSK